MVYFTINLMIHMTISCFFIIFILRFAKINKQRKNTRGISFLFPVLLSILFLFHAILNTFPKLADTVPVFTQVYQPPQSGTVESISFFNNSLVIDGTKYFYNPFAYKPEEGDIIQIYSTPYSHYAAKVLPVTEE